MPGSGKRNRELEGIYQQLCLIEYSEQYPELASPTEAFGKDGSGG